MRNDITTLQPVLQRALNLLATASSWQRGAAKRAHIVGLQGEKRRLRYLYREASYITDWLEHKIYDVFELDLIAQQGTADTSVMQCVKSSMDTIIKKLWTIYEASHQVANELVNLKYRNLAQPIYTYAGRLFDIIAELQRAVKEYERAEFEYHHISRYQVGYYNIHDEYEDKEEAQGFEL